MKLEELVQQIYKNVEFESEFDGEKQYELAKQITKEWALKMVGEDIVQFDEYDKGYNNAKKIIRKCIEDSTMAEEKCHNCDHNKIRHKFGYEEHCLEIGCKCERYES